jgi:flagellar hook-associated protein 2
VDAGNDTLAVRVDGIQSSTITLTQATYLSSTELAAEIQGRINGDTQLRAAGVSVSVAFVVDRFEITSSRFGSASGVAITAAGTTTAVTLGIDIGVGMSTAGVDVAGSMGGAPASGTGRLLTGSGAADGLEVEVRGGAIGSRGHVEYSRGVADRLYSLLDAYLGENSSIADQLGSLDRRKADIDEERKALDGRLDRLEARLSSQFTALDALVAELTQTSDFLTAQLAQLPGNTTNRR